MGTKLSVNINKIATIRNARGGNLPNLAKVAQDCELFGADGITVHPRPDERHITKKDVYDLAKVVQTEFNIEGYPNDRFMQLIADTKPAQATLVPDPPHVLTSNAGWNTIKEYYFLKEVLANLKKIGTRISLFIDPKEALIHAAADLGADRIEFYSGPYAEQFEKYKEEAVAPYSVAAKIAKAWCLVIDARHGLNLKYLAFFELALPDLDEVSISHALVSDALYAGLENAIQMYQKQLND